MSQRGPQGYDHTGRTYGHLLVLGVIGYRNCRPRYAVVNTCCGSFGALDHRSLFWRRDNPDTLCRACRWVPPVQGGNVDITLNNRELDAIAAARAADLEARAARLAARRAANDARTAAAHARAVARREARPPLTWDDLVIRHLHRRQG